MSSFVVKTPLEVVAAHLTPVHFVPLRKFLDGSVLDQTVNLSEGDTPEPTEPLDTVLTSVRNEVWSTCEAGRKKFSDSIYRANRLATGRKCYSGLAFQNKSGPDLKHFPIKNWYKV